MIKKFLAFVLFAITTLSYGQDNTASPYSYYGLGELRFKGTMDARSMGGIGIESDSISLNLLNPASYSRLKLTNFVVGATSTFTTLSNSLTDQKAQRTSFDYLAVGIPMGKFGATFAVLPYSGVGYNVKSVTTENNSVLGQQINRYKRFKGTGNVNMIKAGGAYNINSDLSFGVDVNYYFGDIQKTLVDSIGGVKLSSRELNDVRVSGFSFSAGLMYAKKINEKLKLSTSFSYTPKALLNSRNFRSVATILYDTNGNESISGQQIIPIADSELLIPAKFAFGAGIGQQSKWFVGSEISFSETSKWNKIATNTNSRVNSMYKNATKLSVGGYYIPNYNSYSNYFNRVVYRAGFKYEDTGLFINNSEISDYGMNIGLGLPLGFSKINLGFEYGQRGTTSNSLIQENYFNVSVGLSLSEKWFKRRKID